MSDTAANGFLNILKPPGMSSAAVVGYARRLLGGVKVGHAGTLDPEAAGVLPLMIGKATRLFDYMQDKQKVYVAEVAFGASTDTEDAQGVITATGNALPDESAIRGALTRFTGKLMQRPSAYSAIKRDGRKLYELARRGEAVEAEPREVTVYAAELMRLMPNGGALVRIRCSKGFYVRAFCRDLGAALNCPAHMRFLLRAESGAFSLQTAVTLEQLADAALRGEQQSLILPMKAGLRHLPDAQIPREYLKQFMNGVALPYSAYTGFTPQAAADAPVCLWLGDTLCAIGARENGLMKVRTWLAEE